MASSSAQLNALLADFGSSFSFDGSVPYDYSLGLPKNYNVPPVFAAPTNSNNVGAPRTSIEETGQSILDIVSDVGKRYLSAIGDKVVQSADKDAQYELPGAQNPYHQEAKKKNDLIFLVVVGFIIYKVIE